MNKFPIDSESKPTFTFSQTATATAPATAPTQISKPQGKRRHFILLCFCYNFLHCHVMYTMRQLSLNV